MNAVTYSGKKYKKKYHVLIFEERWDFGQFYFNHSFVSTWDVLMKFYI
jgi:hypothetical protein